MQKQIELILFDNDGTLLKSDDYSYSGIQEAINELYEKYKIEAKPPTRTEIIYGLGQTKKDVYEIILPDKAHKYIEELRLLARHKIITKIKNGEGELFPFVPKILKELKNKGYKTAIVSNSPVKYFKTVMEHFDLKQYFDAYLCIGERPGKHKEDMIEEMQKKFDASNCIMVGDRFVDIYAGNQKGCITVGASYGFGSPEELEKANYKINSFDEMLEIISTIENKQDKGIE